MKDLYLEKINAAKDEQHMSLKVLAEKTGYTDSTLCRYLNGKSTPTVDALRCICNALGLNYDAIAAEIGTQELKASQDLDHAGTNKLIDKYEHIIKLHEQNYERSVGHLKKQIEDLTMDVKEANARASAAEKKAADLDRRRHHVFWGMLALCFAMLVVGVAIYPPWSL